MYNLNQFVMIKRNLLGGALLVAVLILLSGCKEIMSNLSNPVDAYLQLSETSTTIYRGQSYQINYSTISDAKPIFKSADEKIATVDANGVVTGANRGTTKITIEVPATENYNGASVEFLVKVDALLNLPKDAKELALNEEYNLGVTSVSKGKITYKSSNTKVATVDANGNVTAKGYGDATISISIAATPEYDRTESAEFTAKVRIQNLAQLAAAIAASTEVTALLGEGVSITLPDAGIDLSGKKVTIKGDDKKPATFTMGANGIIINNNFKIENAKINGSTLTTPFIKMATLPTTGLNEKGAFEIDYVAFENVETTGIPLQFFYANGQKYLIKSFTVENCQFAMANGNSSNVNTIFDFKSGGNTALLQINNSTIWCNPARVKAGDFFNSQSGQGAIELGSEKQVRSITNSTMYNISYGQNTCSVRRNDVSGMSYVVKNCIIVNCGKSGQFLVGLNGGSSKGDSKVKWEVAGSLFNSGGSDKSADEATKVGNDKGGNAIVTDYLTGTVTFADAAAGDFTQSGYNAGDPRWIKK